MYGMYSKYYDRLNNMYEKWYSFIDTHISYLPKKSKMIEFGCGTGNILKNYQKDYEIYGIDISQQMLFQAKEKLPNGTFFLKDMCLFESITHYDIALCFFDSINHLLDIELWKKFFSNIADNMNPSGIFLFDMNTTERLKKLTQRPPFFIEFDKNYFYMKVNQKTKNNFIFDVRVLKNIKNEIFEQEKDEVEEMTEDGNTIYLILKKYFKAVDVFNEQLEKIKEDQFDKFSDHRWFFICKNPTPS